MILTFFNVGISVSVVVPLYVVVGTLLTVNVTFPLGHTLNLLTNVILLQSPATE